MEKDAFLGSVLGAGGKLLHGLFGTFKGHSAITALTEMDKITNALGSKALAKFKPGIKPITSGSTSPWGGGFSMAPSYVFKGASRRADMPRTLKDVLVEKIAAAKGMTKVARANLPFTVTSNDVQFIDKLAGAIKLGNPMEKTAFGSKILTALKDYPLPILAGTSMLGTGAMLAGSAYDQVADYVKRERSYEQMFNEFPMLNEVPREQVDKYWSVLNDFAPKLTTNPLVAGQFVENMLNYGMRGVGHDLAGQLLDAQAKSRVSTGESEMPKMLGGLGGKAMDALLGVALKEGLG